MRDRSRARRWSIGSVALCALLSVGSGATAQESSRPVDLGAYATPLRFHAPRGTTFEVDGVRYAGDLEVRLAPDGQLTVINTVPMETYVEGIAEMPASWPIEALKAQAVAARTYAWFELEQGRWGRYGFDICATTSCQVYHGREIVETPDVGRRWARAVDRTDGQVLVHGGAPILARYFSTSGGATRDNEDVFPGEGPRPYLKGVEDPDDAVSPLHRWTATFTREQMNAILSRGEQLRAAVPFGSIEHVEARGGASDRVRVTGENGAVVEVGASEFRAFVSGTAAELFPREYPQSRPDGRPLPETLPSSRFEVEVGPEVVRIEGRGWGHGVGMGQFGAMGKAERGLGYREILAAYYNGLEPVRADALPERIRVGLTTGVDDVTIGADGPFEVESGGTTITDRGLGNWSVAIGARATMRLRAPTGYGAPLVVAPTTASRPRPYSVEVITLETVVNKASELSLEVVDRATGEVALERDLGVVEAGRHTAVWELDDADGMQVAAADYDVRLLAVDEESASAGEPVTVSVVAPTSSTGRPASLLDAVPVPPAAAAPWWLVVAALGGVIAGGLAGRLVPVRR